MVYACDAKWWDCHAEHVKESCTGELWIQNQSNTEDKLHSEAATRHGLNVIQGREAAGLGKDVIHYGSNSGYQAINLAYLWGAGRIILLGYDMQKTAGKAHFFGDHPEKLANGPAFNTIIPKFEQLANDLANQGVEVINCTRQTALPYFKRANLEDVLQSLSAQGQASTLAA